MIIRLATIDDTEELLDIYRPYVLDTAITFEYDVPTYEDFKSRIIHTLEDFPYYVAIIDDKIVCLCFTLSSPHSLSVPG